MDIRKHLNIVPRFITLILILAVVFFSLISATYLIPDSWIANNVERSLSIIEAEGSYPRFLGINLEAPNYFLNLFKGQDDGSYDFWLGIHLDNSTDRTMLNKTLADPAMSFIERGQVGTYPRYWHGYLVFLRPMLTVFSLREIRYFNIVLLYSLLAVTVVLLKRRTNWTIAVSFALAMQLGGFQAVPVSLQFSSMFYVMLVASIIVLKRYGRRSFDSKLPYFFFTVGATAAFIDFLTAPLLTLGVPLIIILLIRLYNNTTEFKRDVAFLFWNCASWAGGYIILWAIKWPVGSWILKKDVIANALNHTINRIQGSEVHVVNRVDSLIKNFYYLTVGVTNKLILVTVMLLLIMFIIELRANPNAVKRFKRTIPVLLTALLPYAWIVVIGDHSHIHCWFVYRIQIIAAFALLSSILYSVDIKILVSKLRQLSLKFGGNHADAPFQERSSI